MHRPRRHNSKSMDGLGLFESMEINAPADLVWKLLLNVECYPILYSNCTGIQSLNPTKSINPVEPGAKYVERRLGNGRVHELVMNATAITEVHKSNDNNNNLRVFALASFFSDCTVTSTQILEDLGSGRCRLSISFGFVPDGVYGRWYFWMNRKRLAKDMSADIVSDLCDIREASESGSYIEIEKEASSNVVASSSSLSSAYEAMMNGSSHSQ